MIELVGESPDLIPLIRCLEKTCIPQSQYQPIHAGRPERRRVPSLGIGLGILFGPLILVFWLLSNPAISAYIIGSVTFLCAAFIASMAWSNYRRIRVTDSMLVLMGVSMTLSLSLISPVFFGSVNNTFLATAVVYGVCLSIFSVGGSALYVLYSTLKAPSPLYYEIGA